MKMSEEEYKQFNHITRNRTIEIAKLKIKRIMKRLKEAELEAGE